MTAKFIVTDNEWQEILEEMVSYSESEWVTVILTEREKVMMLLMSDSNSDSDCEW